MLKTILDLRNYNILLLFTIICITTSFVTNTLSCHNNTFSHNVTNVFIGVWILLQKTKLNYM